MIDIGNQEHIIIIFGDMPTLRIFGPDKYVIDYELRSDQLIAIAEQALAVWRQCNG